MSTSSLKPASSGLYVPGAGGAASGEKPLPAYIERTVEGIEDYARKEPWAFAAWVFGVGFVLGWKLKPW